MNLRKVLCLDGGGIKGAFTASFLKTIEETNQKSIVDHFDLIVGTSTGGIIALGLGLGFSAAEMLSFYEDHGKRIFKKSIPLVTAIKHLLITKYSDRELKRALERIFGGRLLGESKCRLVIPSANLDTGEVYVYKTSHHPRFERDYKETAVNVALATSAAPTYFPEHVSQAGTPLVDGGVWANNPLTVAAVEAIGVLKWKTSQIRVLSIGCTTAPFERGRLSKRLAGRLGWATKISDLFMLLQSSAAVGTAQLLIGHEHLVRINPVVSGGKYTLDSTRIIESLIGLGDSEARKALPKVRSFLSELAEDFTPLRTIEERGAE